MANKDQNKASQILRIERPQVRALLLTLIGVTSLLCNRMSDEARQKLVDKALGIKPVRTTKKAAPPRTQEEIALSHAHIIGKEKGNPVFGFPTSGLKNLLGEVAATVGDTKMTKKLVSLAIELPQEHMRLGYREVRPRIDFGRNRNSVGHVAIPIIRTEFTYWETTLPLVYNETLLSREEVVNLMLQAGEVGIGAWSALKNGHHGKFMLDLASVQEIPVEEARGMKAVA